MERNYDSEMEELESLFAQLNKEKQKQALDMMELMCICPGFDAELEKLDPRAPGYYNAVKALIAKWKGMGAA